MARRQSHSSHTSLSSAELEARRVPAASATMIGSTLVVNGDTTNDRIEVGGLNTGNLSVRINNGASRPFTGVQNIKIDGKAGHDQIIVAAAVSGDLDVSGGSGSDYLNVSGRFGDDVTINLGGEKEDYAYLDATIRDLFVGDDLAVSSTTTIMSAKDYLWFQNYLIVGDQVSISTPSTLKGKVVLDGAPGNTFSMNSLKVNTVLARTSEVVLQKFRVNGAAEITTGSGDDTVSSSDASYGGSLKISTNGGQDRVFLSRVTGGSLLANGGLGSSDFLLQNGNSFGTRTVTGFELFGL